MKKVILFSFVVLMMWISGCKSTNESTMDDRLYKQYGNLKSYQVVVEHKVLSNKTENVYTFELSCDNRQKYKLVCQAPEDFEGFGYLLSEGKATSFFPKMEIPPRTLKAFPESYANIFIDHFFDKFFNQKENCKIEEESQALKLSYVNGQSEKQILTVDKNTLDVLQLDCYDSNGHELSSTKYEKINRSPTFANDFFAAN